MTLKEKHQHVAQALSDEGIATIEGYIDEKVCEELYETIVNLEEEGLDVAEGDYGYRDLAGWDGAVISKRKGRDEGMWDIFNIDQEVPEFASIKKDPTINEIINQAAETTFTPDNINIYWNRSVTETRAFHADTYERKYKSFVYLTDVPDLAHGPFGYVPGSHRSSRFRRKASEIVNRLRGKPRTNAVFYDGGKSAFFTAPKGTLIIADQSGYHRGHPQEDGYERMLATTSYTPEEP